jgi:hypothetical protein
MERGERLAQLLVLVPRKENTMAQTSKAQRLTHEEFVRVAIPALRNEKYGKGLHVVYGNFNAAFREYFGTEPREAIDALEAAGKIVKRGARGGVMIYLPEDAPAIVDNSGSNALSKMGLIQ